MEGITLHEHFATLQDQRMERTKRHQRLSIITIAWCAVICGAATWVDVEEFGQAKRAWLETFLDLPNGIPSHDTIGRVFARLGLEQGHRVFSLVGAGDPHDALALRRAPAHSHRYRWRRQNSSRPPGRH